VSTAATMLDTSKAGGTRIWVNPGSVDDLEGVPNTAVQARSMEARHQPINADTFAHVNAKARLERVEADVIAAWGELHQIPGFSPVEGESLPAAIRRAISEAANQGMTS
ncbi:hypothetical protein, partial [Corallococcus praedator]